MLTFKEPADVCFFFILSGHCLPFSFLCWSAGKKVYVQIPGVPILMLSVGDKGSKSGEGITTHPGVLPFIEAQRQATSEAKIAFWNTYKAMGGEKSMVQFVDHKPPMAAKDYTHINYLGGDKIAGQLFNSVMREQTRLLP